MGLREQVQIIRTPGVPQSGVRFWEFIYAVSIGFNVHVLIMHPLFFSVGSLFIWLYYEPPLASH